MRSPTPETALRWFPVVIRYGGFAMVVYELLFENLDRPYLLGLIGLMMGVGEIGDALRERSAAKRESESSEPT